MTFDEIEIFLFKYNKQFAERWLVLPRVVILSIENFIDVYTIRYTALEESEVYLFHITRNEMVRWCESLKLLEFVNNDGT